MKLGVLIDTVAALKAGKNYSGWNVIEFNPADLTDAERLLLAEKTAPQTSRKEAPGADLYLNYGPGPVLMTEPTLDGLRALLAESQTIVDAKATEAKRLRYEEIRKEEEVIRRLLFKPVEELLERSGSDWQMKSELSSRTSDSRLATKAEAVRRLRDERNAQVAREKAAEEEAKTAARMRLRQWALDNGSDLLRLRIEGGYNWRELAREEYGKKELAGVETALNCKVSDDPDGYEYSSKELHKYPTYEQIKQVQQTKTLYPTADVKLYKVCYEPTSDACEDDSDLESLYRVELCVTLPVLDGTEYTKYYCI